MQIAFHIGANCTDGDRLLKSILKNQDMLTQQQIAVPRPGMYRRLIRETLQQINGPPPPDTDTILLDAIVTEDAVTRVVLANENFITIPKLVFDHGAFYPQVERKLRDLQWIFAQHDIAVFLGLRHPAPFLQACFYRAEARTLKDYMGALSPLDLRWADIVARIKHAAPDMPLYVWCNEDTPLIWEALIRLQCGIAPAIPIKGALDRVAEIITPAGLQVLQTRIAQEAPLHDVAQRNIIAEVIETHCITDRIEEDITLAELSPDMIAIMSENYEADLRHIATMEGVDLILPFG